MINSAKELQMKLLTSGNESVFLLSQYMGDFHPDAHVKGLDGCNLIALICKRYSAVFFANLSISICIKFILKTGS